MAEEPTPRSDGPADQLAPVPPQVITQKPPASTGDQIPIAFQQVSVSVGPLPPPEVIAAYEKAIRGAGKRFFKVWEEEAEHRRSLEVAKVTAEVKDVADSRVEARSTGGTDSGARGRHLGSDRCWSRLPNCRRIHRGERSDRDSHRVSEPETEQAFARFLRQLATIQHPLPGAS